MWCIQNVTPFSVTYESESNTVLSATTKVPLSFPFRTLNTLFPMLLSASTSWNHRFDLTGPRLIEPLHRRYRHQRLPNLGRNPLRRPHWKCHCHRPQLSLPQHHSQVPHPHQPQDARSLSLFGNQFTGRLPPSLFTLTSLEFLDISHNRFYLPIHRTNH